MYGASVIIFEGILAFYSQEVRSVSIRRWLNDKISAENNSN